RERLVIQLEAEGRPLDVVEALDALVVLGPIELESVPGTVPARDRCVRTGGLAPRVVARPEDRWRDRLRAGRGARPRTHHPEADVSAEFRVGGDVPEIRPAGELVLPVEVDRSLLTPIVAGEE